MEVRHSLKLAEFRKELDEPEAVEAALGSVETEPSKDFFCGRTELVL